MDNEILKKPTTWAVIIPGIAFIFAAYMTYGMFQQQGQAKRVAETADGVFENARYVLRVRGAAGDNTARETARYFVGIASARECATAAAIPEAKLTRGESGSPQVQNDGTFLRRETYRLDQVRLMQIAFFIDYAERTFNDLVCTQLAIVKARSRQRDSWDLTASIQYLTD